MTWSQRIINGPLIAFVLLPWVSSAQDTMAISDPLSIEVKVNGSARLLRGTFNQTIYAGSLELTLTKKRWEWQNSTSYRYTRANDVQIENNWQQFITASYFIREKHVIPIAIYLFDNNLLFRVNARHLAGLGIGFLPDKWKGNIVRADVGIGFESTFYNGDTFANTDLTDAQRDKPLTFTRIRHSLDFWEGKISLSNIIVYRQSLIERSDFYVLVSPKISVSVLNGLSVNASFQYRYENVHLLNLSPVNTTFLAGLAYRFKHTQS